MKKKLITALLFILAAKAAAQNNSFLSNIGKYLENTEVFELNQVDGHVPLVPYYSITEALKNNKYESSSFISLNGTWKFHYADTPEGTPELFFEKNYNDKGWDTIHVPS